ncbi:MAG: DUF1318 domain-containing protein [Opitutaceae bacterium]|nr:DUF1318 domain-containing protein [Opitutaceae bacterium]
MKRRTFLGLFAAVACLLAFSAAHAADVAGAKNRMRERVPAVDRLKIAEIVGENNRGFLELRKSADAAGKAAVEAENQDRSVVFADAAARAGSTADAVGRAFARQIAAASASGVWIQREDGSWHKK